MFPLAGLHSTNSIVAEIKTQSRACLQPFSQALFVADRLATGKRRSPEAWLARSAIRLLRIEWERRMKSACRRLENGQRELARIRFAVGIWLLALGALVGSVYEIMYFSLDMNYFRGNKLEFWRTHWVYVYAFFAAVLYYSRLLVVVLAPVANSIRVMRLAIAIDAWVVLTGGILHLVFLPKKAAAFVYVIAISAVVEFLFVLGSVWVACGTSFERMRKWIWRLVGAWVAANIPIMAVVAAEFSAHNHTVSNRWVWVCVQVFVLLLIMRPGWQAQARRALSALIEAKSSQTAAAGVAALVGECAPGEVMAQASARFRCVQLCDLSFDDMADNKPNPDLFALARSCRLRRCDAFVSHSWHDDAEAKWEAMQRWRRDFIAEFGREPSVWIDKCCIDQRNIERDLRCLPVFLSGCRRLIVFCGPTYLSRLWCVVELFTFVHMGGQVDSIHFEPVCRRGLEREDFDNTCASFDAFDAHQCTCFLPEDKERMLGVIVSAFGHMSEFNRAVRAIFDSSSWRMIADCAAGGEGSPFSPDWITRAVRRQPTMRRPTSPSMSDDISHPPSQSSSEDEGAEEESGVTTTLSDYALPDSGP